MACYFDSLARIPYDTPYSVIYIYSVVYYIVVVTILKRLSRFRNCKDEGIDLFYYLLDLRELADANDVHKHLVGALF